MLPIYTNVELITLKPFIYISVDNTLNFINTCTGTV